MTTEEKNKWIEREKRFLEKQKEISGNKNASILSQITFCKDGVVIEKFMELNDEGGIAVKANNYLLSDYKPSNDSLKRNLKDLLEVKKIKKD